MFSGWKRRWVVLLEIILEKPEKQTYLCESLEGIEAPAQERMVVSGEKLMAKL